MKSAIFQILLALCLVLFSASDSEAQALKREHFQIDAGISGDLLTGTFITRDPAGIVDGPNEYSYVRQNPWTMFDPDGLRSERHDAIGKDGKITGGLELHHKDFVRDSKGYSNQYR